VSEIDALVEKVREDVRLVQVALARARIDVHGGGKPIPAEDALARLEARAEAAEAAVERLKRIAEQFISVIDPLDMWLTVDGNYMRPATRQEAEFLAALAVKSEPDIPADIHGPCDESPPLFSQGGVAE